MSIQSRLRAVRKHKRMTIDQFADSLGVPYSVVQNSELGRTQPTEAYLRLVCFVHCVSRYFLDTGLGDMFTTPQTADEIAAQLRVVLSGMDAYKVDTIVRLALMPDDWWQALKDQQGSFRANNSSSLSP